MSLNEDLPGANLNGGSAPYKTTSLGDILDDQQIAEVDRLMKKHKDPEELLKALKIYFGTIKDTLSAKGMDPNYLAYVLYAKVLGII